MYDHKALHTLFTQSHALELQLTCIYHSNLSIFQTCTRLHRLQTHQSEHHTRRTSKNHQDSMANQVMSNPKQTGDESTPVHFKSSSTHHFAKNSLGLILPVIPQQVSSKPTQLSSLKEQQPFRWFISNLKPCSHRQKAASFPQYLATHCTLHYIRLPC